MRIHFTELAQDDLANIITYIANDNVEAAYRVRDAVLETIDMHLENPTMAEKVQSKVNGLRRAVVNDYPGYLVFYQPVSDGIKIFRVGSGRQDWSEI